MQRIAPGQPTSAIGADRAFLSPVGPPQGFEVELFAPDGAGNKNAASTSSDNTVTYDGTSPFGDHQSGGEAADPTNASPINFTVVCRAVQGADRVGNPARSRVVDLV